MSSRFYQNAIMNFPNKKHQLVATHVKHVNSTSVEGEEGYKVNIHAPAALTELHADALVSQNATTTVPSSLLNSGQIDFRLEKNIIQQYDNAYLKIYVTNSSGGSVTINPIQLCMLYVQIFSNNGSNLLVQQYGVENWLENFFYSYTEFGNIAALYGTDGTYSTAGVAIANNASEVFYIQLATPFAASRLFMAGLNSELLIRFTFQPYTYSLISGSALTVTNAVLLLRGAYNNKELQDYKMKMYKTMPLDFPFLGFQHATFNLSLAASTNYTQVLSGLTGLVACLFITVRATPLTAANIGSFLKSFSTYDIQDSSGSSLLGYWQRDNDDTLLLATEYTSSFFPTYVNAYFVTWDRSPQASIVNGSCEGFCPFTGFERLSWTTTAALSPGSYQIDVWARTYETLKCRNGDMTVSRS